MKSQVLIRVSHVWSGHIKILVLIRANQGKTSFGKRAT